MMVSRSLYRVATIHRNMQQQSYEGSRSLYRVATTQRNMRQQSGEGQSFFLTCSDNPSQYTATLLLGLVVPCTV